MNYKHGFTTVADRGAHNPRWRAHTVWCHIRQRCTNPRSLDYPNYGGRGITYDPRWDSFEVFFADMGAPAPGLTIERVNNDGNYCKENCRWIPKGEQSKNRTTARTIVAHGKSLRLYEWAALLGIRHSVILNRIRRGWSEERAVSA